MTRKKPTTSRRWISKTWLRQKVNRQRENVWIRWRPLHQRLENVSRIRLKRNLNALAASIADKIIADGLTADPTDLIDTGTFERDINAILLLLWWNGATAGWNFEDDWIRGKTTPDGIWIPDPKPLVMPQPIANSVTSLIQQKKRTTWLQIYKGFAKQLAAELEKAIASGVKAEVAARAIKKAIRKRNKSRAQVTARTENTSVLNGTQQDTRVLYGIDVKGWFSLDDDKTRPARTGGKSNRRKAKYNHRRPNGQVVPVEKPFVVSGELLLYPGDVSLGATIGNLINCRCSSVSVFPNS